MKEIEYKEIIIDHGGLPSLPARGAYVLIYKMDDRREYRVNGDLHRVNGPACEGGTHDYKEWWLNGRYYVEQEDYWKAAYEVGIINKKELMMKILEHRKK